MTYESDLTRMMRELKANNPRIEQDQQRGRAIWWEKDPTDLDELRRQKESKVAQQAYVYQTTR